MKKNLFFPYSWYVDEDQEEITVIRIYGLGKDNENVCVKVNNFTPYVYLELPTNISWTTSKAQLVGNKLDDLLGQYKPLKKCLMFKKRLYYAELDASRKRKIFPYLFLCFSCQGDIKQLGYKIRRGLQVVGMGRIRVKVHEQDANPVLQLTCLRNIPTAGWIEFSGREVVGDGKETTCDSEYVVKWKYLSPVDRDDVARPLIMGFDIEVNSTNPSAMPKAQKPGDKVFQISCVLARQGDPEKNWEKFLLTLGDPDQDKVGEDVEIRVFDTESDLLEGYTEFIQEYNPNVIVGYNILGFDIPYMIERAKQNLVIFNFDQQGFNKDAHARERIIKWSSSAYKDQEFQFLDAEGRLYVDLLPLVKRDYKMDNYKLKTISTHFLGVTKDPLDPKGIFKCYRMGMKGGKRGNKALGVCGKYCIQDSILVMKLMKKLQTWVGLTEMAKVCNVPIFTLYTAGQQIKVFSQVYKKCTYDNYVVEKDGYITKEDEHYVGAHVFDPIAGVHDDVLPFDFSSLYPTVIIAYNIDYSTLVRDDSVPDRLCHVMEWEDHISCVHDPKVVEKARLTKIINGMEDEIKDLRNKRDSSIDRFRKKEYKDEIEKMMDKKKPYVKQRSNVMKTKPKHTMCTPRRYRFLKKPKGIIPTILQNLLDARKNTRAEIKEHKKRMGDLEGSEKENVQTLIEVLNKRQLAYKISANSMYGAMGVVRGYLPFMPGAMCTTAMGRESIELAAKTIVNKHRGKLIYGDSVTEDTPIMCRYIDKIFYRTIDNITEGEWKEYHDKEESYPIDGLEVWTEQGFTKIKRIIRHKTDKEIFRVLAHSGVVDVTEDHGLLDLNGKKVSPKEIHIGSDLLISILPKQDTEEDIILPAEAFVWGLFYADGSCGDYRCPSGPKCSWAINNIDRELLKKCMDIMNNSLESLKFKILETMKSSGVLKLVPVGVGVNNFVRRWRKHMYDKRRYKKVPDCILWSSKKVRQSFLDGYYAGDGDKDIHGYFRFDNKGKIGSAGLYYLAQSLGYKVSINTRKDKMDIYRMTCTKSYQRKKEYRVKKIISLGKCSQYVYDLETENHHFSAGIGKLIVHNTDSAYVIFPHLIGKPAHELWDYAEDVAIEVTKLFPSPINLEFEEVIYKRFLILTKKRYMYIESDRDGTLSNKVGKKGVLLARRDTSQFIRTLYADVIMKIFNKVDQDTIIYDFIREINKMCGSGFKSSDFVTTKSVGAIENYKVRPLSDDPKKREKRLKDLNCTLSEYRIKCLPAHVQLAEKMRRRGLRVDPGSRLEYVITVGAGHKAKQSEKLESADYYKAHATILKLDYMYYLKLLSNPMDQVFSTVYKMNEFVLKQYKYRLKWTKVHEELLSLFAPRIEEINFIIEK